MSLALAHLGAHTLWLVLLVSTLLAAVTAAAVLRRSSRPDVRVDVGGLIMIAALECLCLWLFVPGFHYGAGDKDPGVYPAGHRIRARREKGLAEVGPLCGMLAVMAAALALRGAVRFAPWGNERAALADGSAAGVLLTTNMLEVWQAKYPPAEISAQMLWVGVLLALVVTMTTRWRFAAGVAGLLVGVGFLDRADGWCRCCWQGGSARRSWQRASGTRGRPGWQPGCSRAPARPVAGLLAVRGPHLQPG